LVITPVREGAVWKKETQDLTSLVNIKVCYNAKLATHKSRVKGLLPFYFQKTNSSSNQNKKATAPLHTKIVLAYNYILCISYGLCRKLFVNFSGQKAAVKGSVGGGQKIQRNYFVSFRSRAIGGSTATNTRVPKKLSNLEKEALSRTLQSLSSNRCQPQPPQTQVIYSGAGFFARETFPL